MKTYTYFELKELVLDMWVHMTEDERYYRTVEVDPLEEEVILLRMRPTDRVEIDTDTYYYKIL